MAPHSPHAPGTPAEAPSASPLDPRVDISLHHHPARAAAVLIAMRPPQRHAHLLVHADIAGISPAHIQAEWADVLRLGCTTDPDEPPALAPIEPEELALLEPEEARRRIAALTPAQRVQQSVAQAAWLASFGYDVGHEAFLAAWEADDERQAV